MFVPSTPTAWRTADRARPPSHPTASCASRCGTPSTESCSPTTRGWWAGGSPATKGSPARSRATLVRRSPTSAPEELDDRDLGRLPSVYTPLQSAPTVSSRPTRPAASSAFEIYLPYEPLAAAIATVCGSSSPSRRLPHPLPRFFRWSPGPRDDCANSRRTCQALRSADGLPNRVARRPHRTQRAANRSGLSGAVMLVDLDRFKEINDTLGTAQATPSCGSRRAPPPAPA